MAVALTPGYVALQTSRIRGKMRRTSGDILAGDVRKRLTDGNRTINTAGLIADEAAEHTRFDPAAVLEDSYGVDDRRYVVFNQLKYDYDDTEKDEMAMIDRCLVLEKGDPPRRDPPEIDWRV
jgi:hypothetical protein